MEQVRSRPAVEQAVTVSIGGLSPPITRLRRRPARIALLAILATGLALPAPSVFAHGNQFIAAKLTIGDGGRVDLELTADHGDNPNIADVAEAREVLRGCLQVCLGDERFPLEHFGPLIFSERQHYGDDSPLPLAEAGPHRLVVASWRADLPAQRVVFAAQGHTPFDVVLWRAGGTPVSGTSRWTLLIAGDRSPEFIMTPASLRLPAWSALLLVLPLMPLIWHRVRRVREVRDGSPMSCPVYRD
jgi:hypothetical protein